MKKESDKFLDELLLAQVNEKIENLLQEELEKPEKAEPKKEDKASFFMWFMLIILISIVIMKLATIIIPFIK